MMRGSKQGGGGKLTQKAKGSDNARSKWSRSRKRDITLATLAFLLPLTTGILIATGKLPELASAIVNFFVTEPVKGVNVDRGYTVDTTSQVNVYDTDATTGYILKARLGESVDPTIAVGIWSEAAGFCTKANPCRLSSAADTIIYGNGTASAATEPGDILDFGVRLQSGMDSALGLHNIDIIYTKQRAYTMQSFGRAACDAMPTYEGEWTVSQELVDMRDGKTYNVRKLSDGNCWMVDNLALEPLPDNPIVLDNITSDLNTIESYTLTNNTTNMGNPNTVAYCNNLDTATYPNKCGLHYSWTVATAGSTITSGNAPNSICPKGWRLPTGGSGGEYATLASALNWGSGGANVNNSAWRGLYAGIGGTSVVGSYGNYWSSTATSGNAYDLSYYSSNVDPASTSTKSLRFSVRCLLR